MCHDLDSRPPIVAIAGGALDGQRVGLSAADGNAFAAYRARPAEPSGAGIVILPDVRGLHPFYEELALRFAERGIDALAIDYFGRTAGAEARGDAFEHMPHAEQTTWAGISSDIAAGVDALRREGIDRIFTIGFCMGGRMSFLASTLGLHLAGVIGMYGTLQGPWRNDAPAPLDRIDDVARAGPRAVRRRGPGHHRRGDRRLRSRPGRTGHRPPDRHLPGRAAQLLRPEGRRLRRGERGGLERGHRLHRGARGRDA